MSIATATPPRALVRQVSVPPDKLMAAAWAASKAPLTPRQRLVIAKRWLGDMPHQEALLPLVLQDTSNLRPGSPMDSAAAELVRAGFRPEPEQVVIRTHLHRLVSFFRQQLETEAHALQMKETMTKGEVAKELGRERHATGVLLTKARNRRAMDRAEINELARSNAEQIAAFVQAINAKTGAGARWGQVRQFMGWTNLLNEEVLFTLHRRGVLTSRKDQNTLRVAPRPKRYVLTTQSR